MNYLSGKPAGYGTFTWANQQLPSEQKKMGNESNLFPPSFPLLLCLTVKCLPLITDRDRLKGEGVQRKKTSEKKRRDFPA